ncbi:substrate-binding domain-containing protein [Rhodopseudomonas palustris]|uniref:substrate-binding domain-containing protein n=1 Tax=Rhodopseudomonas palustris TaxID=1076 RepID=UPI0020CE35F4
MSRAHLKIGLLVPQEGPCGIWAPSCEASAVLAIAELNHHGGVLGRDLDLIVANAGATDASAREAAAALATMSDVDVVVAMVTSSARTLVAAELKKRRVPFVYTPQFEGGVLDPDVMTVGETADDLLKPGLSWLATEKQASRFFLIGNDYVWPLQSMGRAKRIIRDIGGAVVGNAVVPFGVEDHEALLRRISDARPHVIVSWLLGNEAVVFNRAFAESGLSSRILRFSTAIDETILYAIGESCTANLYVASGYFSCLRSHNNSAFLERYHDLFGETPPPMNAFGESLYEGVHCVAGLVEAAESLQPIDLRRKVGRAAQQRTARGFKGGIVAGATHPIHLAVADGHDFRVIASR